MDEAVIVLVNTNEPELAPWQGARKGSADAGKRSTRPQREIAHMENKRARDPG